MQTDIADGVGWLVAAGIADPRRIAIYGVSYGGYAALAGVTFTPERYAAGISLSGPANLFTLIRSFPPYRKAEIEKVYREIGDPREEQRRLIAASPFFHVDRIQAPLLIGQGAADPRVRKPEIDKMVYHLRRRGIPVAYMVKANEGHVFQDQRNQMDFYAAMEVFLARHLGGRATAAARVLAPLETAY
jgi:dipeptidyl aminopeptidase/acylaminoacyl peptidase